MKKRSLYFRTAVFSFLGAALCAGAAEELPGRIETFDLKGPASGMEAEVKVYLPPAYDGATEPLPVMYFLHGSGGVSGIKILAGYAEQAVSEKICRPFLIVELKGPKTPQCWWVDASAADSKAGTLVSQDLITAVEGRYRTQATREGRIIAGFSMGGFGAMAQLFQHPDLFATGVAYDGGFHREGQFEQENLRRRFEQLFGGEAEAFLAATPQGRAAQYARRPEAERPPVDYQLLIGAFGDRIAVFQQQLEEAGVALPGRVIGTPTKHNLAQVLESCWRDHFRYLEQRLAAGTEADPDERIRQGVAAVLAGIDEPLIPERTLDLTAFSGRQPDAEGTYDFCADINRALVELNAAGGGNLVFPNPFGSSSGESAVYRIRGPVNMQSNTALRLARGIRLQFEFDPPAYRGPDGRGVLNRYEGTLLYMNSPLIRAFNCSNIAITGLPGDGPAPVINGDGDRWTQWWEQNNKGFYNKIRELNEQGTMPVPQRQFGEDTLRPTLMNFFLSRRILVQDVRLEEPPFWTLHPVFSENVVLRRIEIYSRGIFHDGIDPDSSRYVLIEDCRFNVGDDNVVIKSGRGPEGRDGIAVAGTELETAESFFIREGRIGGPSSFILTRNCALGGLHGVVIGSEISGGAHDLYFLDNEGSPDHPLGLGVYFKGGRERGGTIRDVFIKNLRLYTIRRSAIFILPNYRNNLTAPWPTRFQNIFIENLTADRAAGIVINGWPDAPVDRIVLRNVSVKESVWPEASFERAKKDPAVGNESLTRIPTFLYNHVSGLKLENVTLNGVSYTDTIDRSDDSLAVPY